jgi:methylase of polypeptide subunit release factors
MGGPTIAAAPADEAELAALARAVADARARPGGDDAVEAVRAAIRAGGDPLGEAFARIRPAAARRAAGATYTPAAIVRAMTGWAEAAAAGAPPARVVDAGAGSGRFLSAVAAAFPAARLVAVETDPLARLLLVANAAAGGWADRLRIVAAPFRAWDPPPADGPTLFVGNPPYLRHHGVGAADKAWYAAALAALGLAGSTLAGLHLHFLAKIATLARPGDLGVLVMPSEWLDVPYGAPARALFAGPLGGASLHLYDPAARPFADAMSTACIAAFRVGRSGPVRLARIAGGDPPGRLAGGRETPRGALASAERWTPLFDAGARQTRRTGGSGGPRLRLGDLFAVHRGQATGANRVWIAGAYPGPLPPEVLLPAVTKAREIIAAAPVLAEAGALRRVADLPADLDALGTEGREEAEAFLAWARERGAADGWIARHRRPWWAVRMGAPAAVLVTYMARRPPVFAVNACGARHLNIAHGLHPRDPLPPDRLLALVGWLSRNAGAEGGRIYAGGLAKFEPREIERLEIPPPDDWGED